MRRRALGGYSQFTVLSGPKFLSQRNGTKCVVRVHKLESEGPLALLLLFIDDQRGVVWNFCMV